jgi:uncharacterized protein (DUF1800 family)
MKNASRRRVPAALMSLALAAPSGAAEVTRPAVPADDSQIVHVLNRLGYGPRPGDVEAVRQMGVLPWIEQQLHPERITDRALSTRLTTLRTVALDTSVLLDKYELPREAKREIQKKRAEMESASEQEQRRARREFMQKYRDDMDGTPRQVVEELQAAKVLRAVYSERQLEEVMVDFWLNHFNVFANKGPVKFLTGEYEREVIRPRVWGKFEDLLKATAQSPAMLFYLDNWLSADPSANPRADRARLASAGAFGMRRGRRTTMTREEAPPPAGRKRGLNENYAREIMELHTLGVDGGYTQKDVTEVARCFTGWTIRGLRQGDPEFAFDARLHDKKDKLVLGRAIKPGGQEEGEAIIHLLATHPSTARFISYKLARRFVADEPPAALVERAAETFRKTDGDIRSVVSAIVTSPEFLGSEHRAAKVKTPFEFAASAVRAAGADVVDARDLSRRIGQMGMPLYLQQPPTGYKDTADAWVSTSGLLARLNLALDLATGKVRGVTVDKAMLAPSGDPKGAAEALAARLVPSGLSPATRQTLAGEAVGTDLTRIAGLILGSPEFQRR